MKKLPTREVFRYSDQKGFYCRTELMSDVWHNVLRHKPIEFCRTMMENNTWFNCDNIPHVSIEAVQDMMQLAKTLKANLLLNVGPLGDGSIHPQDRDTRLQLDEQGK